MKNEKNIINNSHHYHLIIHVTDGYSIFAFWNIVSTDLHQTMN